MNSVLGVLDTAFIPSHAGKLNNGTFDDTIKIRTMFLSRVLLASGASYAVMGAYVKRAIVTNPGLWADAAAVDKAALFSKVLLFTGSVITAYSLGLLAKTAYDFNRCHARRH